MTDPARASEGWALLYAMAVPLLTEMFPLPPEPPRDDDLAEALFRHLVLVATDSDVVAQS